MGLFNRKPRCPHNRIRVSAKVNYLGDSSPTIRGFCVEDGHRVEIKVKGVSSDPSDEMLHEALQALGWRSEGGGIAVYVGKGGGPAPNVHLSKIEGFVLLTALGKLPPEPEVQALVRKLSALSFTVEELAQA